MPAPSDPVRVLVAGLGAFGGEHLGRLMSRADVNVVGIADKNPAALARGHRPHGMAQCHDDPLAMIDASDADAVIVATPAASHVEICMHALRRGLCVLLEKPIATSAAAGSVLRALSCRATCSAFRGITSGWSGSSDPAKSAKRST